MIVIDSFSPEFGLTVGGTLVELLGSGFAPLIAAAPVPGELAAAPAPSVRVRFGLAEAEILAQSETRLLVRAPAVTLEMVELAGEVDEVNGLPTAELDLDIVVENLDGDGLVLESAEVGPWSYRLPQLADSDDALNQIVDYLLRVLRLWLHPRVWHKPHPDYAMPLSSADEADVWIFNRAEAPAFALLGPDIARDPVFEQSQVPSDGVGEATRDQRVYTCRLTFQLLGFAPTLSEMLAMQNAQLRVFRDLVRIPAPGGDGTLDLDLTELPRPNPAPRESGLLSFSSTFVLRGVRLGLAGSRWTNDNIVEWSTEVDTPEIGLANTTSAQVSSPSPGPSTPNAPPPDDRPVYPRFVRLPTLSVPT